MTNRKPLLFCVLNVVQAALTASIPYLAPSRSVPVNAVLWGAAALMLVAAPAIAIDRPWGRWVAAVACLTEGLLGLTLAALCVTSASYLYTMYGWNGRALGGVAYALAIVVAIAFWLIPAHELHFLRSRQRA